MKVVTLRGFAAGLWTLMLAAGCQDLEVGGSRNPGRDGPAVDLPAAPPGDTGPSAPDRPNSSPADASADRGRCTRCDDGLICTRDICLDGGTCENQIMAGWCLIGDTCYKDQVSKPGGPCTLICDASRSQTDWSKHPGRCAILGRCYSTGNTHPGGCAECDPAVSSSRWTVKGNYCLIYDVCRDPGDKGPSGCQICVPGSDKYGWSHTAGACAIDGKCYPNTLRHPGGCGVCDSSRSITAWTPVGSGCIIDFECHALGAKHPSGCGVCDPTWSRTSWTVPTGKCLIHDRCYATGAREAGGCGTCASAASTSGWTMGTGCLAVHDWSATFGGSSSDHGLSVSADTSGNIYLTGFFSGSITFGSSSHSSRGSQDIFLASFTENRTVRWSRSFGGTGSDHGRSVTTDPSGNIYVTGNFDSSISFGGSALSSLGGDDVYLASFDWNGKHRWSRSFGGTGNDHGHSVATDGSGNVYVTGWFTGGIHLGGTASFSTRGLGDIFLASYDRDGKYRWARSFGSSKEDSGFAVAADSVGNTYITGHTDGGISFGGTTLTSRGGSDTFVAAFTTEGVHRWARIYGGTGNDYGHAIDTDVSGNVALTGSFRDRINFGGTTLTSRGQSDVFVVDLSPAGAQRWSKGFGGTGDDAGYGVATDPGGNLYVTGRFNGSINFGGGTLSSKGSDDIFLAGFSAVGDHRWSRAHGQKSADQGRSVAVDPGANVYCTGSLEHAVDLGGGPLSPSGIDAFLVKLRQK